LNIICSRSPAFPKYSRLGIRLTQVNTRYRLRGDGRIPSELDGVGSQIFYGRKL
jgi:hypothetical protein